MSATLVVLMPLILARAGGSVVAEWTKPSAGPLTPEWVQPNVLDNLNALREDTVTQAGDLAATQGNLTTTQASLTTTQASLTTTQSSLATTQSNLASLQSAFNALNAIALTTANWTTYINSVPAGAIVTFRTAGEIPSGWSRETNLDGRILIGAGTAGGSTFAEGTNYGTNWQVTFTSANNNPASGAVNSGAGSTAVPTHTHDTAVTLIPPSRAYVYARKN